MENRNLPERSNHQESSLTISARAAEIAVVVADVNMLVGFPIDGGELMVWAKDIERLCPGLSVDALRLLFDGFKTERIPWDKSKGIQNIFAGLEWIKKTEEGFEIKKPQVW